MGSNIAGASANKSARAPRFLVVALVISVVLNAGLAYRLNQFIGALEAQIARIQSGRLKAGEVVPSFGARRVGGKNDRIERIDASDDSRSTVLYVLSPACGWCKKNESSIRKLAAVRSEQYRFVGISLAVEGAEEYATSFDLGMPFYTGLSEDTKEAYKMKGTPQTIVVSPKGVVEASWYGAYAGRQKDAIEDFFKVKLPEIDLKSPKNH